MDARTDLFALWRRALRNAERARVRFSVEPAAETLTAFFDEEPPEMPRGSARRACRPSIASSGIASKRILANGFRALATSHLRSIR